MFTTQGKHVPTKQKVYPNVTGSTEEDAFIFSYTVLCGPSCIWTVFTEKWVFLSCSPGMPLMPTATLYPLSPPILTLWLSTPSQKGIHKLRNYAGSMFMVVFFAVGRWVLSFYPSIGFFFNRVCNIFRMQKIHILPWNIDLLTRFFSKSQRNFC